MVINPLYASMVLVSVMEMRSMDALLRCIVRMLVKVLWLAQNTKKIQHQVEL